MNKKINKETDDEIDNELIDMINENLTQIEVENFISDLKEYDIFVILSACIILEDVKNSYKSHLIFIFAQQLMEKEKVEYNKKDASKEKSYLKYVYRLEKVYKKNDNNKQIVNKALDKICSDFVKLTRIYYNGNENLSSEVLSKLFETVLYANIIENEQIRNQL